MFLYNIKIAGKSLRRNPIISLLMMTAIAVGIGTCMALLTIRHQMSGDPLPHKSNILYAVQLDAGDPNEEPTKGPTDVSHVLTYRDAMNLIAADTPAKDQAIMAGVLLYSKGVTTESKMKSYRSIATDGSFFSMFGVPFLYGSAWSSADDESANHVVVISRETNDKLFGGINSVGKQLMISDEVERFYKVVGVVDHWNPMPMPPGVGAYEIYIPFNLAPKYEMFRAGPLRCWKGYDDFTYQGILNSECSWVIAWAELESESQAEEYLEYLNRYTEDQKQYGRFQRPVNSFITKLRDWNEVMDFQGNSLFNLLAALGFMFLSVCLVNTAGLLLAKFFNKSHEIGLRRALGANKKMMFSQCLTEVGFVGFVGGVLGIGMSLLGLQAIKATLTSGLINPSPYYDHMLYMDWQMMLLAVAIAIVANVLAGLYPIWRVCQVPPANHLRPQ